MSSTPAPTVAIIGRPNVGKSTLFNRLIGTRRAITASRSGTTRDVVSGNVSWGRHNFILTDTAGFDAPEGEIESQAQEQLQQAVKGASLVLVVVDATTMATNEDQAAARLALKSKKPVILVMNKADDKGAGDNFGRLGIKQRLPVSAIHGSGTGDLLDAVVKHLGSARPADVQGTVRLALLGRPNVGKSSLLNALVKRQEAIVSDVPGTTRDVRITNISYKDQQIQLLDTAGLRRRGKIEGGVEKFSTIRTAAAIASADVCAVIMDATELAVAGDQHITGMVKDAGKGLILVVNKWDIPEKDDKTQAHLARRLAHDFEFVAWAPLVFTSATTNLHTDQLLELALEIHGRRAQELPTGPLNRVLEELIRKHPPAGSGNVQPKINYVTQTGTNPPTFTLFSSHPRDIHFSYKRYLENGLRAAYDFIGTPITLEFRAKRKER